MLSKLPSLACFLLVPSIAVGQSWTSETVSAPGGGGYRHIMLIVSLLALLLLLIFAFLLRRVAGRSNLDSSIGMGIGDLKSIEKKGLLTQEEVQRVRQAMARQMTKKLENSKKSAGGLAALMADPEIIRLQEMAEAKRAGFSDASSQTAAVASVEPAPAPDPRENHSLTDEMPAIPGIEDDNQAVHQALPTETPVPSASPDAPADSVAWHYEAAKVQPVEEDVQLPPDVLGMAKLGLITEEELENMKARIREKKKALGTSQNDSHPA